MRYLNTGLPEAAVTIIDQPDAPALYARAVEVAAEQANVSPVLLSALVWQESRWRANAVSRAGARGLSQLMPGTARDLGVDANDPSANLGGGARYLRQQLDRFGGNIELALAAYNAGPGRVARAGGVPAIRETQVYVASIMARLASPVRR
jgi:soluble lytic murein transglycosylase-like protein